MTIQIENSGASIKVTKNGLSFYIPKPYLIKFVPTVTQPGGVVRPGTVTIQYSEGIEAKQFDFVWTDCTSPLVANIQLLVNAIEAFQDTGIGESISITSPIGQQTMANSVSVVVASNQTPVAVKGTQKRSSLTLTRPAPTTAYTAKDVISNSTTSPQVLTFTNVVNNAGDSGYFVKCRAITNQNTCTARLRLHLYDTAPTAINDNDPFTLLAVNADKRIGVIDFPAFQTEGTGSDAANSMFTMGTLNNATIQSPQGAIAFTTVGVTSVYGILETLDAFTPANAQTFFIELTSDVNG